MICNSRKERRLGDLDILDTKAVIGNEKERKCAGIGRAPETSLGKFVPDLNIIQSRTNISCPSQLP